MSSAPFSADAAKRAKLVLRNDIEYKGYGFGADKPIAGEVVFATGMVGYPESLTDPSYHGQILVFTSPMVGNYGIPGLDKDCFGLSKHFESQEGKIWVSGVVVSELCTEPEHWQNLQSLHEWLKSQGIPGVMMVDTRNLVLRLRELGTALGKIDLEGHEPVPFNDSNVRNLVAEVSTREKKTYGSGSLKILCVDMGVKLNTLRCFLNYDVQVTVVPHNHDITKESYDGLFISNGPGNPQLCEETIRSCRWALAQDKPIFGICMGNQIMALAAGGETYKMKFGHRGQNQPCTRKTDRDLGSSGKSIVITTQNHGFAVDFSTMPEGWEETFANANDKSNEGIGHKTKPYSAVQFHPEGRCGPMDTEYLFKEFVDTVKEKKISRMKKLEVRKILVLGAGGITIAQAGEFDYSGSQCLKSLREEGIETVLINPNIATVQTDYDSADKVYCCPVTPPEVERIIEKERPDGLLLGWGGQTALNCGVTLENTGVLAKYNVRVLGTPVSTIALTEDRELFRDALLQIHEHCAESAAATTVAEAVTAATNIGYPVMIRAAFTLGGQGSGIVDNEEELKAKVRTALAVAPQVLVEESVKGWKEIEYEVVRDIYDNCLTVCNMENFDPMGVHTGESIVVAPSQTLSNDEYHMLRTAAVRIIRHLGVVGECNIQYGLDPVSKRYVVIEVNARLSRSSALASKATGYPLAHVAAKLALGKGLHEITNGVTKTTPACFEPSLDYIVCKMPRWDLNKFNLVSNDIGSMMKSVGEVMAIGRTFEEVVQKALRMVDPSYLGFRTTSGILQSKTIGGGKWDYKEEIRNPTPQRIWAICEALHDGVTVDEIHELSKINKWFLHKLQNIVSFDKQLQSNFSGKGPEAIPKTLMRRAKCLGFSDKLIAHCIGSEELAVRGARHTLKIHPSVKQIDTTAGEFPAAAVYLYTSYNASYDDVTFTEEIYAVLGCGVYRIGNSVEFDYCGVLVTREMRRLGLKVLTINYNPETVSTDYDECDRLYFEEVNEETVSEILRKERTAGVCISVGGQIVQNMALGLKKQNLPILGTDPSNIDRAEDRAKFSQMCDDIGVPQPEWTEAGTVQEVIEFAAKVSYPVLVRPSYVLSGSGMSVIWSEDDVRRYLSEAVSVSSDHPVVVSKYYQNASEFDVDIVAHRGKVLCYSISEHIEQAGVHSGDATMFLPPRNASSRKELMKDLYDGASKIATSLDVIGPMNVQFLATADGKIRVIEANVRCSRSVPFVSKTLGISFPAVIVSTLLSSPDASLTPIKRAKMTHVGCKMGVFSFNRLAGADPILGVEMSSTGEVGVFGRDHHETFLKAMMSQKDFKYPKKAVLIAIEKDEELVKFIPYIKYLTPRLALYTVPTNLATLAKHGFTATVLTPPLAKTPATGAVGTVDEYLCDKKIDFVIQLRDRTQDFLLRRMTQDEAPEEYWIRRQATDYSIPLITEPNIAAIFCEAFDKFQPEDLELEPMQHYIPKVFHKLENNSCTLLRRHKVGLAVADSINSLVLAIYLKKNGIDVTAFHADLGQPKESVQHVKNALEANGVPYEIVDLRDELAECCCQLALSQLSRPLGAHGTTVSRESSRWPINGVVRHVIRGGLIKAMQSKKCTVCAQSSGRSRREMRFEEYLKAVAPDMGIYTPWRDPQLRADLASDQDRIDYLKQHGVEMPSSEKYKQRKTLAGAKFVAEVVKDLPEPALCTWPEQAPKEAEFVTLTFREGYCVQINETTTVNQVSALAELNTIAGRNGVGLSVCKSGTMYETPGLTLLGAGLAYVYEAVFDRATADNFRVFSSVVSQCMENGRFNDSGSAAAIMAIKSLAGAADGVLNLELSRGQIIFLSLRNTNKKAPAGINQMQEDFASADDLVEVFQAGTGQFTDVEW